MFAKGLMRTAGAALVTLVVGAPPTPAIAADEVADFYRGKVVGIWVMRPWATANAETLVKYLAAIIEGIRWASAPANRSEATAIVAKHLKLDPQVAARSVEAAVGAKAGLAKDAAFDLAGFRNTLKLRAEMAGGDPNAAPEKYLDLSFYQRALASF